jgi:hypothetical protein
MILLLSTFAFATFAIFATAAAAQTPPPPVSEDLLVHNRVFQSQNVTQLGVMLQLPAPPAAGYTQEQFLQVRVDAAVQYFISHGYLLNSQGLGVHLSADENGVYTLVITGPGIHIVIVLPCGPFLPTYDRQLMSATVVRWISNGF